jgi:hypothetical protein
VTEPDAKYAMESKYDFLLKLKGTKPNQILGKVFNYHCSVPLCGLHIWLTCSNATSLWTVDVSKNITTSHTWKDVDTHPKETDSPKAWTHDNSHHKKIGVPQQMESNTSVTVVDCYCLLQRLYNVLVIERLSLKVVDGDHYCILKHHIHFYITLCHFKRHGELMSRMLYYQKLPSSKEYLPVGSMVNEDYTSPEDTQITLKHLVHSKNTGDQKCIVTILNDLVICVLVPLTRVDFVKSTIWRLVSPKSISRIND